MEGNTILVVDDQTLNLYLLKDVLKGYRVILAKDGEQALAILKEEQLPDLILLDILMPGMTGYEVIKVIKDNERTKDIPVIFITGLNSAENEEEGLNLGAMDYIVKPFNSAIVRARIRNALRLRNQQRMLENLVHIDGLTEIPNRRNLDITLDKELKSAARNKRWLSLMMIDVDKFKHYNDSYGHAKGDEALIKLAKTIRSCLIRPDDFAARYGGEEFFVVLPDTDEVGGKVVADTILRCINTTKLEHQKPQGDPWLTISLGGYSLIPEQSDNQQALIEKADALMYTAKKNGGNQVVWGRK